MLGAAIFVITSLVLVFVPASNGCSCFPRHQQRIICDVDFVILGFQIGDTMDPESPDSGTLPTIGGQRNYTISVMEVFKGDKKWKNCVIEVSTGSSSAACGVDVKTKVLWLLTGYTRVVKGEKVHSISLCDWNSPYSSLTPQQRTFIEGTNERKETYLGCGKQNCNKCEIKRCPDNDCSNVTSTHGACDWDGRQCYRDNLSCQFSQGSCLWSSESDASSCINTSTQ